MTDQPRCETCRWWSRPAKTIAAEGTCHRFPPTGVIRPCGGGAYNRFPSTLFSDFCGEHQPKEPRDDGKTRPV